MKNILFTLLISANIFAQQSSGEKMNIIKTNVTAYAFRNINLSYERTISKRFSMNVGFGTMAKGDIPFAKAYLKDTEFSDAQVGMTNFTIEPRVYLGKGYGHGFYLAPYYRNSSFNADNVTYTIQYASDKVPIKISGKATGNSGGLMLGSQWFLGNKENWVLDFWIIGAHYGAGKGDFRGNSSRTLSADEQAKLKSEIEGLDIPFVKYKVTTDANGANMLVDGPWAGIRSGLSFGYRF